ncbi:FadR/GntR family transcriptional regulator [Actinacidiphila guanduensis]|uniref:DNA-binding transcriptional regulator, FadR family n=1 Tax=Actinacidiphila guanduensis TaxID=310781 RepID=A0A1H0SDK6_9ACTN|nr:FCD domain-containing protein [Actinacidiphila guanduensis]SDP39767.1 DNA-binding transcriptional regulator, FadR family [Actinacidiphila guanduensis]
MDDSRRTPGGGADTGRRAGHGGAPQASVKRAESAAQRIAELAAAAEPGSRLGTKEELRAACGVSVGTFNEALRLAHSRGLVAVRPGPGGGLFAAEQSALVRLGNSVLALDAEGADVAEAIRMRDALDPLLVADAVWHASLADVVRLRQSLAAMRKAAEVPDPVAFVHANWQLHARIADLSPSKLLKQLYLGLLEIIESHTLAVLPMAGRPLPQYLRERHRLHCDLVDAIADHRREEAMWLVGLHNTSGPPRDTGDDPAAQTMRRRGPTA